MTPLERKAAFAHAVTMRRTTRSRAAKEELGVSLLHLRYVLDGTRVGSAELLQRFADFIGRPLDEVWPEPVTPPEIAAA